MLLSECRAEETLRWLTVGRMQDFGFAKGGIGRLDFPLVFCQCNERSNTMALNYVVQRDSKLCPVLLFFMTH